MNAADLQRRAQHIARLLKTMSDVRRLMILHHLAEGERSVNELVALIGASQSGVSQHLARLRRAELVTPRRSAQMVYYSLNGAIPAALLGALHDVFAPKS